VLESHCSSFTNNDTVLGLLLTGESRFSWSGSADESDTSRLNKLRPAELPTCRVESSEKSLGFALVPVSLLLRL
jgi:hypothetical protein